MALLYDAVLRPSKTEIVSAWAPTQPWFSGENLEVTRVASFRFDDPDGAVGIETLLVRAGTGPLLQIPLTYRGAPLAGSEAWLIGTMTHSALGDRWVYDGTGDPAYLLAVATAARTGGSHAEQFIDHGGVPVPVDSSASVRGSGRAGTAVPAVTAPSSASDDAQVSVVTAGSVTVTVLRVLGASTSPATTGAATLSGTWPGQAEPLLLVTVEPGVDGIH